MLLVRDISRLSVQNFVICSGHDQDWIGNLLSAFDSCSRKRNPSHDEDSPAHLGLASQMYQIKEWLLSDIISGVSTGLVGTLQGKMIVVEGVWMENHSLQQPFLTPPPLPWVCTKGLLTHHSLRSSSRACPLVVRFPLPHLPYTSLLRNPVASLSAWLQLEPCHLSSCFPIFIGHSSQ